MPEKIDKSGLDSVKRVYNRGKQLLTNLKDNNPFSVGARGGKTSIFTKSNGRAYVGRPEMAKEIAKIPTKTAPAKTTPKK